MRRSILCGSPGYDAAVTSATLRPSRRRRTIRGIIGESTVRTPPSEYKVSSASRVTSLTEFAQARTTERFLWSTDAG